MAGTPVDRAAGGPHERVVAVLVTLRNAARAARDQLAEVEDVLGLVIAESPSRSAVEVTEDLRARGGGPALRRQVAATLAGYGRAVTELRATIVQTLVDSGGMTLTDAAQLMGISRPMASRLYHADSCAGRPGAVGSPEHPAT